MFHSAIGTCKGPEAKPKVQSFKLQDRSMGRFVLKCFLGFRFSDEGLGFGSGGLEVRGLGFYLPRNSPKNCLSLCIGWAP